MLSAQLDLSGPFEACLKLLKYLPKKEKMGPRRDISVSVVAVCFELSWSEGRFRKGSLVADRQP